MPLVRRLVTLAVIAVLFVAFSCLAIARKVLQFVLHIPLKRVFPVGELVTRTPDERFAGLAALGYDFKPNYLDSMYGGRHVRMHYVDEGPRDAKFTVLLLHGEPSWSFLYRKVIGPLSNDYRVVAPDFIGFGKSDKLTTVTEYTHQRHCASLATLVHSLDLQRIVLVVQDWGGLTGLATLPAIEKRVDKLVIMNTGLPSAKIPAAVAAADDDAEVDAGGEEKDDEKAGEKQAARAARPPQGAVSKALSKLTSIGVFMTWRMCVLALQRHLPVGQVFKSALIEPGKGVLEAYDAPFHCAAAKAGAAQWPLLVPVHSSMQVAGSMQEAADFLGGEWRRSGREALVMFSDRDAITRGAEKFFLRLLGRRATGGRNLVVRGAGHFLQEDAGEVLAANIAVFLEHGVREAVRRAEAGAAGDKENKKAR